MLPEGFTAIKLGNHDNSETKRYVLDRTEKEYDRALTYFDRWGVSGLIHWRLLAIPGSLQITKVLCHRIPGPIKALWNF